MMFTKIMATKAIRYVIIGMMAMVLLTGIFVFSFQSEEESAMASGDLVITLVEDASGISYGQWSPGNYFPILTVGYYTDDGNEQVYNSVANYTWTLTNIHNSSYTYTGNQASASIPAVAGHYSLRVVAGSRFYDSDGSPILTFKAIVVINKSVVNPFESIYDGTNRINNFSTWASLQNHFIITNTGGMPGIATDYSLALTWGSFVSEVKNVGLYDYTLNLQKVSGGTTTTYDYIEYGSNTNLGSYQIKRRPILLDKGIVLAQKEKMFNGNEFATGFIYKNGEGTNKYDYLLNDANYGANTGFIAADLNAIKLTMDTIPLLNFRGLVNDTINSYFMDSNGNPSSTVSETDASGNVLYDKRIQLNYALNTAYPLISDNYIIARNTGTQASPIYTTYSNYAGFVENNCRILPGVFTLYTEATSKEYGVTTAALSYQIVSAENFPLPENIAIKYSGDLLEETLGLYSEGTSGIRVRIKIGRLFDPAFDTLSDIDFIGLDGSGDPISLIEYTRFTPFIGEYYFYAEVFYDGVRLEIDSHALPYSCGSVNLKYTSTKFTVTPKQLVLPVGFFVNLEKEYDGLLQANNNYSVEDFSMQWVLDQYYVGANLIANNDGQYIEAIIRPVFNNPNAGSNKTITVTFQLRLTPSGVGKNYLLSSYFAPEEYTISNATIRKRQVNYSFDMSSSINAPISNPFLFPDSKILIFEKAYSSPLPIIKDLLFGDYVLDQGNIIYEDVYMLRPKTFINPYGLVENEIDFYGNIVYEEYGEPVSMPKRTNYFLGNDDPNDSNRTPSGFDWEEAIDWSYYCIEELYPEGHEFEGMQKIVQVSRYVPNGDGSYSVYIVDQSTVGAVLRIVNQQTPPSGNPGIGITLKEFYADNYVFVPKDADNSAFMNITKKDPEWNMAENQSITYNSYMNSNMIEDIELTLPLVQDYSTYQEYVLALADYNFKLQTYREIIKINLNGHGEFLEIIGKGGTGININVIEYAPPGQEIMYSVDSYDYKDDILLIKHAGRYKIQVSLPETTTYRASEVRDLYLTINQANLRLYLSPTERHYNEENPPSYPLPYKVDTLDSSSWGWRLDIDEINTYMSTLVYFGFVGQESPDNIGFGSFVNSYVDYGSVKYSTQPGTYSISASGGSAHNYTFIYSTSFSILKIIELKAEIILINDEIEVIYNPDIVSWRVNEYQVGIDDPLAAYVYPVDDLSVVDVLVVGYKPINLSYDFSLHYVYLKDISSNLILDEFGNPIIIEFNPKIVYVDNKWIPYTEGAEGEIRDCSPPQNYHNAKNVGQYIMKLSASANFYQNPDPKFVLFKINYAETVIDITEGIVQHEYNNSSFYINGIPSLTSDDNFVINNKEIRVFIKVEFSQLHYDDPDTTFAIVLSNTAYRDDMDTKIKDAGFYKITFMIEYIEGDIINYYIPEGSEHILKVQVIKGKVILQFGNPEGSEQWYYRGTPYQVLDPDTMQATDLGVYYSVTPAVPFESIIVQIYKYQYYFDGTQIPLDESMKVNNATDVGLYLFRLKASGESTNNYDDSDWIEQNFEIKKATVNVYIQGRIDPNGSERYPLQKIYGEDNPEDKLEILYTGWKNGESPENSDPNKIVADFSQASINWNLVTKMQSARPNTPYSIIPYGASSTNYTFEYNPASFFILRKQAEVIVNQEYTTAVYTGIEQQNSSTFRNQLASEEGILPLYAFSLNYNPMLTNFSIGLVGRKIGYYVDTSVTECIDVGEYVFSISATQSENYNAIAATEYTFTVVKAELKAYIEDAQIVYGDEYPAFALTYSGYLGKDISVIAPTYILYNTGECEQLSGSQRVQNLIYPNLVIPTNAINYVSGGYTISLVGGSARNYWINVEDTANLNITKRNITIEGNDRIIKEYDGTNFANNYVNPRHYKYIGVIHHYLKPSIDIVGLNFQARFDSPEVGRRTVSIQELRINNTNYNLITVQFTCEGEITKLTPIISFIQKTFTYDGLQKEMFPIITGLPQDEVSYIVKYKGVGSTSYMESQTPPIIAGSYEVTVTTNDPNYVDRNYSVSMVINKAKVNILFGGDIMQTYGGVTGLSARAIGIAGYSQSIPIKYYDTNQNEIEDITQANQGRYTAKAIYAATANYLSAEGNEEVWINSKSVSVTFYSVPNYVYDGKMKHLKASFYNITGQLQDTLIKYAKIVDGVETFINLNSEGGIIEAIAPKDAGLYIAYAVAPNDSYTLTGDLSSSIEITPRLINIRVNNIVIKNGETPVFTYNIQGIATGDSLNTLDVKPSIEYYDEGSQNFESLTRLNNGNAPVGVYRIRPYGAMDINYIITYTEGRMVVNSVQLIANTTYSSGLMLEGSFSPDTNVNVKVVQSGVYSKASTTYDVWKMDNDLKDTGLTEIYEISISEAVQEGNIITVRLLLDSALRGQESYRIAHIKPDGSVEIIEASEIEGEYLVFSVSELGNFSVIVDSDNAIKDLWIYVAIAVAILIILLGVVIIKKKA